MSAVLARDPSAAGAGDLAGASASTATAPATPIGLLVTDLDRTLTDLELRLVPQALQEVDRIRALGVPVALATGRQRTELPDPSVLERFDHLILEGGALVGTPGRLAPQEGSHRVKALADWLEERGIAHQKGVASLSTYAVEETLVRPAAEARGLQVVRNNDRLDVTANGVSKGSAIRQLRRGGALRGPVVCAGDGENDIDMFAASHYRVAVANAHPRLMAVADEVTEKPGGVGLAAYLAQRIVEAP